MSYSMRPAQSVVAPAPIGHIAPLEFSPIGQCVTTMSASPSPTDHVSVMAGCTSPVRSTSFPLPLSAAAMWPRVAPPSALPLVLSPTDLRAPQLSPPVAAVRVHHPGLATAWIPAEAAVRPAVTVSLTTPAAALPYAFPAEPYPPQGYVPGMQRFIPIRRARDCTKPLKEWLVAHRHNPYPTKSEKYYLVLASGLSINQVSMWFANARRRIKKVGLRAWSKGTYDDSSLPADPTDEDENDVFAQSEGSDHQDDSSDSEPCAESPSSTSGPENKTPAVTSHLYNEDRTSLGHASGGSDLATETAVSSTGHGSPEGKIPSLTSTSHSATRDTDPDTGYCGADSTSGEQEYSRLERPQVSEMPPLITSHQPPFHSYSVEPSCPRQLFISSVLAASGSPLVTWNLKAPAANLPPLEPHREN